MSLETEVELGPEATADVMADDPHVVGRHAQRLCDAIAHVEGELVRDVEGVAAIVVLGDDRPRLEVGLVLPSRTEDVLHDVVCPFEGVVDPEVDRRASRPRRCQRAGTDRR